MPELTGGGDFDDDLDSEPTATSPGTDLRPVSGGDVREPTDEDQDQDDGGDGGDTDRLAAPDGQQRTSEGTAEPDVQTDLESDVGGGDGGQPDRLRAPGALSTGVEPPSGTAGDEAPRGDEDFTRPGQPPGPGSQGAPGTFESETGQTALEQGVETGEGRVAEQARRFEQEILASTKFVSSPDAVRIVREGDTLRAMLTPTGRRRFRQRRLAEIRAAQRGENRVTQGGTPLSVQIDTFVDELQAQPTNRLRQGGGEPTFVNNVSVTPSDRELAEAELEERVRQQAREQLREQGFDPDDVVIDVERTAGGGFEVDVSADESEQFGDIPVRFPTLEDEDPRLEQEAQSAVAGTVGDFLGVPVSGDTGATIVEAAADEAGIGGERFEDVLEDVSGRYRQTVIETTEPGGVVSTAARFGPLGLAATGAEATGREDLATEIRDFQRTALRDLSALGDVPAAPLAVKEGGELVVYGVSETASGRGEEFARETGEAGSQAVSRAVEFAVENPVRTVTTAGTTLIGSAAIFGAASRVGRGASVATRYAIQPGEELAGLAGFRATRAVAGEARAQRFFPNQEPLIFSEEAAIRAGRRIGRRARQLELDPEVRSVLRGEARRFRESRRGQLDLTGTEVRRGEVETEDTVLGEEDILDEQVSPDPVGQSRIGPEFDLEEDVGAGDAFRRRRRRLQEEAEARPRGVMGDVRPGRVESPTVRRALERRRRAETPTDFTGQELLARGRLEALLATEDPNAAQVQAALERLELAQRTSLRGRTDLRGELRTDTVFDTEGLTEGLLELEAESELEQELEAEAETEAELEAEQELEFEQEQEQEQELEVELELEGETEVEGEPVVQEGEDEDVAGISLGGGRPSATGPELGTGWLNEFVTAYALGPGPRRAPTQEELAAVGGAAAVLEQRPTAAQLEGGEETQAALAEAEDVFSFEEFGVDVGDGEGGLQL